MRARLYISFSLFFLSFFSLRSQTAQVYSQYFINPYVYNPALAGVEGHPAFFLMVRQQWLGVEGAPMVSHANWHMPLRGGIGVGTIFYNDRIGPLERNGFKFSLSYLLNLDRMHFFRFGMSLGAVVRSVDFEELIEPGYLFEEQRNFLAPYVDNSTALQGDVGLMYHFDRFNVGISLPELISSAPLYTNTFATPSFSPWNNIIFKAYYRHSFFNDRLAIDPNILYKYSALGNSQYEATMLLHIFHWIWTGISYRQDAGYIGLAGAKFTPHIAFGYAYGISNSHWAIYSPGGTHEVYLGIHLGRRKDHVEHAHSFIKSRKKEEAREEEEEVEEEVSELVEEPVAAIDESEEDDVLADDFLDSLDFSLPEAVSPEAVKQERSPFLPFPPESVVVDKGEALPVENSQETWQVVPEDPARYRKTGEAVDRGITLSNTAAPIKQYALGWVPMRAGEQRSLDRKLPLRKRKNAEGREEIVAVWRVENKAGKKTGNEEIIFPIYSAEELEKITQQEKGAEGDAILFHASRSGEGVDDERVSLLGAILKKGNHPMELPVGSYVVVGSFVNRGYADRLANGIRRKGASAQVGYNSQVNRYYVTLHESHDVEEVRRRRDLYRQNRSFSDAWVLTIID